VPTLSRTTAEPGIANDAYDPIRKSSERDCCDAQQVSFTDLGMELSVLVDVMEASKTPYGRRETCIFRVKVY
jgi:hypothetical protein